MTVSLCLGSAQFGLRYGITNSDGKVSEDVAKEITRYAASSGFKYVDTAQGYGNAEEVLGKCGANELGMGIIDKVDVGKKRTLNETDVVKWRQSLGESMRVMGCKQLDTIMIHNAECLQWEGSECIKNWLKEVKDGGQARRIGVSIYECSVLDNIEREYLDVVQIPLSIYDQRAIKDKRIQHLVDKETAIHCRSIFLQGLLAIPAERWPKWTSRHAREHHKQLEMYAHSKGRSLAGVALEYIKSQKDVETAVVGICDMRQLNEISSEWNRRDCISGEDWVRWKLGDVKLLDPRYW